MVGCFRFILKVVFSCFLFLHPAIFPYAAESASRTENQDVQQLQEYVVSDTPLPSVGKSIFSVPSKVTLITAEDIRKSGAKTVQEAIQSATGIVFYNQIGNNVQQNIGLRGFSADPVPALSVFVDGVRINEPDFNTINWDLIPYETIEKIEIFPGSTALFGKNALAGIVKITTKQGTQKRQVAADTLFGSFQRERYTINTSGPIGETVAYYFNGSRETENGFRDETAASMSRFYGKIGLYPTRHTDIDLSYTYVKNRLLQAGTLRLDQAFANRSQNASPGDFVDSEHNSVRINANQKLPFGFIASGNTFYRRLGRQTFVNSGGGSTSGTLNETDVRGGTLQLTHEGNLFQQQNVLVVGGEYTRNDFASRGFTTGSVSSQSHTATDEDIVGLYVQDTFNIFSNITLTGGFRYDHDHITFMDNLNPAINQSRRFNRITSRAGMTYHIQPGASVYVSFSEGFRIPTTQEMFTFIGSSNPNLKPIRSQNLEVGAKAGLGNFSTIALALYQTIARDEIFFTCTVCMFGDPNNDGMNRNINKARRRGVEVTLKGRLGKYFDGIVNYTFTESQFRSEFAISTSEVIEVGDSLPLVPKNRLSITGNLHPTQHWTLSLSGLYVSTQFLLNDAGNIRPRLPGYFVLNGRIAYERPMPGGIFKGFVMVNNMLDSDFFSYGIFSSFSSTINVVPAAPLALFGGLSYEFDGFSG